MKAGTYYQKNRTAVLAKRAARAAAMSPAELSAHKTMNRLAQRKWAAENRDKVRQRYRTLSHWRAAALTNARKRARKSGVPFNLDLSDIQVPETCPVLGIPLKIGRGDRTSPGPARGSPSLDRLKPERGYVKGNVQTISSRANTLKRDATIDELRAVIAYMEAHELYA